MGTNALTLGSLWTKAAVINVSAIAGGAGAGVLHLPLGLYVCRGEKFARPVIGVCVLGGAVLARRIVHGGFRLARIAGAASRRNFRWRPLGILHVWWLRV